MKYYQLSVFLIILTVCVVLLVQVIGAAVLNMPTNAENSALRIQLVDLMKYMAGAALGIISAKLVGQERDQKPPGS